MNCPDKMCFKYHVADFLVSRPMLWLWRLYPGRLKVWLWLNADLDALRPLAYAKEV
jgi:hypothetical protein